VTENLLRAADVVAQYHAGDYFQRVLGYFNFPPVVDQRIILKTICQMAFQVGGDPTFLVMNFISFPH